MDTTKAIFSIAAICLLVAACSSNETVGPAPLATGGAAVTGGTTVTEPQGGLGTGGQEMTALSGGTDMETAPAVDASMATVGDDAGVDAGPIVPADPEFESCINAVEPICTVSELDTAELMETPCFDMKMIPVPLTAGGNYGPMTIEGGPYGGRVEWNVGAGTEFVNPVSPGEIVCVPIGIDTFNEPKSVNDEIKNLRDVDYSLYTIFRPACFRQGETYPVITWANGTCGEIAGYAPLLSTLASHGFVIIASNSTATATAPTDGVQVRALDYAEALNEDANSIFYQKLDLTKIGAMGHSQGARATGNADGDDRIKAVVFWNAGSSNEKPFLNVSGDRDVSPITASSMDSDSDAATQPGAWVFYHQVLETGGTATGHLVLMEQPERVIDMTLAWWQWRLNGDEEAKKMFVGDDCGLCNKADEFEYGHNSLLN